MTIPQKLTIPWLREKYLEKALTPREVITVIIARANTYADKNIYITPPTMDQLKRYLNLLDTIDMEAHPLWGIPFTVKDNIDVEGYETTAACPSFAFAPKQNAGVVQRLVDAGGIPVGKANLDQFATGLVGTRSPYGPVHNALQDELISGGSSSGSAVSVALGISAFSLGTDTAGSGRVPAALNGLFGFKPSCGAWPTKGVVPACASLDCVTVFAHTMEDCLTVDASVRGLLENDPWSKDVAKVSAKAPEKVLLPNKQPEVYGPFADAYQNAWEKAVTTIEKSGMPVERVDISIFEQAAAILYDGPWIAERYADLGDFVNSHPGKVFLVTEKILGSGGNLDAAELFKAIHKLQAMKCSVRQLLKNAVLVMPTAGGTWSIKEVEANPVETNSLMGKYTNHCNLLDLCACSIPMAPAAEQLPFGITAFALSGKEGLITGFSDNLQKQ
ncbi:MAG: allophanate hydrolase [Ethanoligenens sp.]